MYLNCCSDYCPAMFDKPFIKPQVALLHLCITPSGGPCFTVKKGQPKNSATNVANSLRIFFLREVDRGCKENTVVKVDGEPPQKGGLVRSHDKPIHGSCAIYFPGAIAILMIFKLVDEVENWDCCFFRLFSHAALKWWCRHWFDSFVMVDMFRPRKTLERI